MVHTESDKTFGRSRSEEDQVVIQWLVYLLSKVADVDKDAVHAFHTAFEASSTGTDRIVNVTRGPNPEDPLDALCRDTTDPLTSVAFLPEMPRTGVPTRVAARNFDFRGLILLGSFNQVHNGHITLAQTAQQLLRARTGLGLHVAFELAVANADKGAIDRSTIVARIAACAPLSTVTRGLCFSRRNHSFVTRRACFQVVPLSWGRIRPTG
ncbi:hypothetical protein PsorP6_001711 [Peronosclerospora sorghi]|uniref:Uncharacterized protein n=1 Tax=Peronosclerospora sorghi TaxID=230839 RepID=A0ACC0WQL4_9STRA|nr:hypothetical protein PsorP6_001711 [Peronosclerospora sorghi]